MATAHCSLTALGMHDTYVAYVPFLPALPTHHLPITPCARPRSYDRAFIEMWLVDHSTCPYTGQPLPPSVELVPNAHLKKAITKWARLYNPLLLVCRTGAAGGARAHWLRSCSMLPALPC